MTTETDLQGAQEAIQNARSALRRGNRSAARGWAEQAAKLAPELEEPWLILASVASPRASVVFVERALEINPDSPRARKGMQWALNRLQKVPAAKRLPRKSRSTRGEKRKPLKRTVSSALQRISLRGRALPILVFALGCVIVLTAAWTASTSPAMASFLNGKSLPASHPNVWAQVAIAKPTYTPEPLPELAEAAPTLASPTPTSLVPTAELEVLPSSEPSTAPALPSPTAGSSFALLPEPTQAPTLAPPTAELSFAPLSEPTSSPTLPPPTATPEPGPTLIPEDTSTPAGDFVMAIVEDTPVPTARPTQENVSPAVQAPVGNGVRWIEVNLSQQRVYAWEGNVLIRSFIVSTGTWQTPTVVGTFSIWNKTRIQTMSGPGYSLPNVPWVMYFYKDYGFHGTYWHNNFGTPMSHGCINLTIPDAQWLYGWASYGTTVKVHY